MGQDTSSIVPTMSHEEQLIHDIKAVMQFITCSIIIPVQLLALFILLRYREFRQNASYLIVARIIFVDLFQSLALLLTGFYQVFPHFPDQVVLLRKICGLILTSPYHLLYALQLELTIYRILVVTGKCKSTRLPVTLKIIEGLLWLGAILFSIGTYIQDSKRWADERWYYDLNKPMGQLASDIEVYVCIPLILVTCIVYTFLISMIFLKNKHIVLLTIKDKKDVSLYMQNVIYTVSHVLMNGLYHLIDICEPCDSPYLFMVTKFIYNTGFYWTALFLLLFNDSIRSKIWDMTKESPIKIISGSFAH